MCAFAFNLVLLLFFLNHQQEPRKTEAVAYNCPLVEIHKIDLPLGGKNAYY